MCAQGCDAPPVREQLFVRTKAGRDVQVGRSTLGDTDAPDRDVSLYIGYAPDGGNGAGAALTPDEARQLAAALLQRAAAAEGGIAGATSGQVEAGHLGGESYLIAARGHTLLADQPATAGGADTPSAPSQLTRLS